MNDPGPRHPASAKPPRAKDLAANLAVLCGAVLFTLIALETALRISGFAATDWYSGGPGDRALDQSAQSNAMGFRDKDYAPEPPAGAVRIVLLGDSFAWGAGVFDDNAIFPALAEKALDKPQQRVELLNASRKGAHTWKELDLYRRARTEFKPDIVVLIFFVNDVETPMHSGLYDPLVKPALPWVPDALRNRSHLFHLIELRVRVLQERSGRRMDYAGYMHALYRDEQTLQLHERALDEIKALADADGARLVIVNMPMLHPGPYRFGRATNHIRAQAARLNAPFFDLQPVLSKYDPAQIRVSNYDGHLNKKGHRIVAGYLSKQLEPLVRETAAARNR